MGCTDEGDRADQELTAFLQRDPRWSLHGSVLTLRNAQDVRTFAEA
jgi:hypothetical protein